VTSAPSGSPSNAAVVARLSDLANGAQGVPLGRIGTSMPRLEERFGPYVETMAIDLRNDRERERRREGVMERIAAVAEHPEILVERISAHHSIWTQTDVGYELARVVGIDSKELGREYAREVATVTEAVTGASYVLYQDDKQTWLRRTLSATSNGLCSMRLTASRSAAATLRSARQPRTSMRSSGAHTTISIPARATCESSALHAGRMTPKTISASLPTNNSY
jgi:hypothetical protein